MDIDDRRRRTAWRAGGTARARCLLAGLLVCLSLATPAGAQYPLRLPPRPNVPPAPLPPLPAMAASDSTVVPADGQRTARLRALLAAQEPRRPLRVTMLTRDGIVGRLHALTGDTLWLAAPDERDAGRADPSRETLPAPVALTDIARVEQQRSGAEHGGEVGGTTGVILGGLLGLSVGAGVARFGGDGGGIPSLLAWSLGGAAIVGTIGSLTGSGVGATGRAWYVIWPVAETSVAAGAETAAASEPTPTRVLLEAGGSRAGGSVYDVEGLELAAGLLGQPDRALELGGVIRYHALGGRVDVPPAGGSGTHTELQPIASITLDLRWVPVAAGWRPWLDGGLGFSVGNDLFTSAHVGLGLRVRDRGGRDYGLVVRRHAALVDITDGLDAWWTAGLMFAFSP